VRLAWLIALVGCSVPDSDYFGRVPEPDPTHFTWCNNDEPEWLDPGMASATNDVRVVIELFDGLTTYDANASPIPSIATSWEVAPDLRKFTFHLRDDARWSNGRPITAEDFVYSLARVLHPLTASTNADSLWHVVNGKAYNAGTARMVMSGSRAGQVVQLPDGAPDTNLRRPRADLALRAAPSPDAEAWMTLPAGADVTLIEPRGEWGYVYYGGVTDGIFGWVPLDRLDAPNDHHNYFDTDGNQFFGRDLLMTPEILGLHAPDSHTLVIETDAPMPFLVEWTVQRWFRPVPREAVSRWPRRWTRPEHIVTSGPFHLIGWWQRDRLELRRSTTFWDRARVRLERVTILSMNDQAANTNVYYQGGCDALASNAVPSSYLPALQTKKDYTRGALLSIYLYLLNVQKLSNVHLRRALGMALDRSMLPVLLKGGQIPTEAYVPGAPIASLTDEELALCGVTRDTPGVAMIVTPSRACYVPPRGAAYDPEGARRELDVARRELGAGFPEVITIKFNTGVEQHKTIAEWAQHEWQRTLGLRVEVESQDWKTFLKATLGHEYDVARMSWNGNLNDPEMEFLNVFRCGSPDNRTGWCDPEYERLFDAAALESDRVRRLAIIRQAEARMIADAPVVPLYVYTQHVLIKPYVRGLAVNLTDHQSLRDVWIDPDWRRR
jgi:ABC-type oligopeptide transport system substrate-binding subunit